MKSKLIYIFFTLLALSSCSKSISIDEQTEKNINTIQSDLWCEEEKNLQTIETVEQDEIKYYHEICYSRCVNALNALVNNDVDKLAQVTENNSQYYNHIKGIKFSKYSITKTVDDIDKYNNYKGIKCYVEITVTDSNCDDFPIGTNEYVIESTITAENGFKVLCLSSKIHQYNNDITDIWDNDTDIDYIEELDAIIFCKAYSSFIQDINYIDNEQYAEAYTKFLIAANLVNEYDADKLNTELYNALGITYDFKNTAMYNPKTNLITLKHNINAVRNKSILLNESIDETGRYKIIINWYNDSLCLSFKEQVTYYLLKTNNKYYLDEYKVSY